MIKLPLIRSRTYGLNRPTRTKTVFVSEKTLQCGLCHMTTMWPPRDHPHIQSKQPINSKPQNHTRGKNREKVSRIGFLYANWPKHGHVSSGSHVFSGWSRGLLLPEHACLLWLNYCLDCCEVYIGWLWYTSKFTYTGPAVRTERSQRRINILQLIAAIYNIH